MSRMSELTRKPSLTALLPQPVLELEYISGSKNQVSLPRLRKVQHVIEFPNDSGGDSLEKQLEQEFARVATVLAQSVPLTLDSMRLVALRLVQEMHRSEQLVAQVFAARPLSSRLVSNALNVAVLTTKLGMGLQYAADDLIDLAVAALVHDLESLGPLASRVSHSQSRGRGQGAQSGRLPDSEGSLLQHVPQYPWLAEVAGQVHERWSGQGTPNGLKGQAIHEYAQVIGLADRFERLINEKGLTAHEAMRRLLTKEKTAFRGQLLKTLVQQISLFPVGTVVRLNTGEMGTVAQTNPGHPLRPLLRMVPSAQRAAHEVETLKDLSQDRFVHIEKALRDHQ